MNYLKRIEEILASVCDDAFDGISIYQKGVGRVENLLHDFSEELIGEKLPTNTGLPMIDEPNQYKNIHRAYQIELRDKLLGGRKNV